MLRRLAVAIVLLGVVATSAHAHPSASHGGEHATRGAGALAMLAVAVAATAVLARARGPQRRGSRRRLPALAAAVMVTAGLVVGAPHLVHHAFDADPDASCAVLKITGHADATTGAPALAVAARLGDAVVPAASTTAVALPPAAARGRAPPA